MQKKKKKKQLDKWLQAWTTRNLRQHDNGNNVSKIGHKASHNKFVQYKMKTRGEKEKKK